MPCCEISWLIQLIKLLKQRSAFTKCTARRQAVLALINIATSLMVNPHIKDFIE